MIDSPKPEYEVTNFNGTHFKKLFQKNNRSAAQITSHKELISNINSFNNLIFNKAGKVI